MLEQSVEYQAARGDLTCLLFGKVISQELAGVSWLL